MGKGNHRFRLSDMMPNAWFYKLKDMTKSSSSRQTQTSKNKSKNKNNIVSSTSLPPTYYNFSTQQRKHFPNPPTLTAKPASVSASSRDSQLESPRRSSTFRKRYRRRTIYRPSPRLVVSSSDTDSSSQSEFYKPFSKNEEDDAVASSESEFSDGHGHGQGQGQGQAPCSCSRVSRRDIIIDMKEQKQQHEHQAFSTTTTTTTTNASTKPRLPPIITKPASKQNHASGPSPKLHGIKPVHNLKSGDDKAKNNNNPATLRRTTVAPANNGTNSNTTGIRIRANSPRIASRKLLHSRKSVSSPSPSSSSSLSVKFRNKNLAESLAVVKSSVDPESDFRASMAEMIKENKISASNSKDLEDLLACYLSLNSRTYHNHIVKAFEQIWFDITHSPSN